MTPSEPPPPPPVRHRQLEVRTPLHVVQGVVVLLQQPTVGHSVGHGQLYLPGLLSLQQQPGGRVELDVGHVGCRRQLLGLGLDELLVTIPGGRSQLELILFSCFRRVSKIWQIVGHFEASISQIGPPIIEYGLFQYSINLL